MEKANSTYISGAALERKESLPHAATRMHLETSTARETGQTHKENAVRFHLYGTVRAVNTAGTERRTVVSGGCREGKQERLLNRQRVWVSQDRESRG